MDCECMTGGYFCGRCGSDDPPKVGVEQNHFRVKCMVCGHVSEAPTMREAFVRWEEKANVKEDAGGRDEEAALRQGVGGQENVKETEA